MPLKRQMMEGDDDDRKRAAQPGQGDTQQNFYVYLIIQGEIDKVKVSVGDEVVDIKKAMKIENSNTFASVDPIQIQLYEFTGSAQPLDALEKWNPDVTWGTATQPLIVKIERRVAVSPWSNSSIGEFALVAQGESGSLWLIISTIFTLLTQNALIQNAQKTPIKWN
jgi:hypothetical protein